MLLCLAGHFIEFEPPRRAFGGVRIHIDNDDATRAKG